MRNGVPLLFALGSAAHQQHSAGSFSISRNRHVRFRKRTCRSAISLWRGVVQGQHWLTDHQFVDAVAVAMITPDPVVITVAFIDYLVAGVTGATRQR